MQKGVSTIIATLLMLVITIGLAGVAYTYISGSIQTSSARQIDAIDGSCIAGVLNGYSITIRNLDAFNSVATSTLVVRIDDTTTPGTWNPVTVAANGGVSVWTHNNGLPSGAAGTAHRIKVLGPANADTVPAFC